MRPQDPSGKPPRKKSEANPAWVGLAVFGLLAALLAGVEVSRRSESDKSQEKAKPESPKSPSRSSGKAPGKAAGKSPKRPSAAQLGSRLDELEQLLASGAGAPETSTDSGLADPWHAWLILRAQGHRAPEPAKLAVRELLREAPPPPLWLEPSPRLAILAALLEAKSEAPLGSLADAPNKEEALTALAFRIDILGLSELARPRAHREALALAIQRGLTRFRGGLRASQEGNESPSASSTFALLLLSQALFRSAPLVAATAQSSEIRRGFALLSQLEPQLESKTPEVTLLLHAAMCESVAAYVHVQQQLEGNQSAKPSPALRARLRASTQALLDGLDRHAALLDPGFDSHYALTLSLRALRVASKHLGEP